MGKLTPGVNAAVVPVHVTPSSLPKAVGGHILLTLRSLLVGRATLMLPCSASTPSPSFVRQHCPPNRTAPCHAAGEGHTEGGAQQALPRPLPARLCHDEQGSASPDRWVARQPRRVCGRLLLPLGAHLSFSPCCAPCPRLPSASLAARFPRQLPSLLLSSMILLLASTFFLRQETKESN